MEKVRKLLEKTDWKELVREVYVEEDLLDPLFIIKKEGLDYKLPIDIYKYNIIKKKINKLYHLTSYEKLIIFAYYKIDLMEEYLKLKKELLELEALDIKNESFDEKLRIKDRIIELKRILGELVSFNEEEDCIFCSS
jgi:hypothetical protein